jgi:Ca2+/Na+ antiporter
MTRRVAEEEDGVVRVLLMLFAAYLIVVGLIALLAPATFFEQIGPFGTRNDHYARDGGTFQVAIGVAALLAGPRPGWRFPVLLMLALQFALHAGSHFVDFDAADPRWLGRAEAVALALTAVLLTYLAVRAGQRDRRSGAGPARAGL